MDSDIVIICQDCQKEFSFSTGEQKFFQQKGFEKPKRCINCRRMKKSMSSKTDGNRMKGKRN